MLISRKHGFIFIHIYKNAGTSITAALAPLVAPAWKRNIWRVFRKTGIGLPFDCQRFDAHARAVDLRRRLGGAQFDSLFSFAIVRNPWDWQVSLYKYMTKFKGHPQNRMAKAMGSFDAYIRWRCEMDANLQRDFIYDGDRSLVDYVGRFERLDEDFEEICGRIGVSASLPRLNVSNARPYWEFYTEETRDLVGATFARDIETFGYRF